MPRGRSTFNKRQKEQQRKEKQQAKIEKRLRRRRENADRGPEGEQPAVLETNSSQEQPRPQ